jgi:hypothetical protein
VKCPCLEGQESARLGRHRSATGNRRASDGGHCPDFVVGKTTTCGFHQSVQSKQLNPPVKGSYGKLILWWALVFLSIGWMVFYINTSTKNSAAVLSPPLTSFRVVACRHVPTVAGSLLGAQSVRLQASVFPVGTLLPLPALRHFNGAGKDVIWLVLNLGQGKLTEHGLGHCIGSHGDYFRAIRDC